MAVGNDDRDTSAKRTSESAPKLTADTNLTQELLQELGKSMQWVDTDRFIMIAYLLERCKGVPLNAYADVRVDRVFSYSLFNAIEHLKFQNKVVQVAEVPHLFITDVTNDGSGTVSAKTYQDGSTTSPTNKVLSSVTSDDSTIEVHVEVDASLWGALGYGWQPTVSIVAPSGGVPVTTTITNLTRIGSNGRRFSGSASVTADASGTIYALTSDGGRSQNITYTRALDPPLILTAVFSSSPYPGSQTQLSDNDTVSISGTTETHANEVYVKDFEVTNGEGLQGPFTVTAGVWSGTINCGTGDNATAHFKCYSKVTGGTAGADYSSDNTVALNDDVPLFSSASVSYPTGQEAVKNVEAGTVSITHTNAQAGDTYSYDDNSTGELTIDGGDTTTYIVAKPFVRLSGNYRESGTNYRVTATRTTLNGKSATKTATVKIAHTTPTITISGTTSRLGSDDGTNNYLDRAITIQSSQANLSTYTSSVSLTAPKGTWQGSWTTSGSSNYTRSLRVADTDILTGGQVANNYTWGVMSVKNRAGLEATVVTTNTTYSLGGFATRTLTQPAAPTHQISIGLPVVDTTKLTAVNLSKGGSPTQTFENSITEHNNSDPALNDFFTISNGSDVYQADGDYYHNSDKLFSDSNSSGTAQISIGEAA